MTNLVFRFATVQGRHVQWFLRRHCSITPVQLCGLYVSLCVISFGISFLFWLHGATLVLPFASLELLGVGVAFLVYARHAADGEAIFLQEDSLVVELETAGKFERTSFQRDWVRVEPGADDRSLIELSGRGKSIRVGRFIRPELRPLLAKEIRFALRTA